MNIEENNKTINQSNFNKTKKHSKSEDKHIKINFGLEKKVRKFSSLLFLIQKINEIEKTNIQIINQDLITNKKKIIIKLKLKI